MAGGGRIRQLRYFGRRKRPHTHPHAGRKPQCCFHEIIAFSLQLSQECIKLNATTCVVVRTRSPPKREREKRVMNARTRSGITTPPPLTNTPTLVRMCETRARGHACDGVNLNMAEFRLRRRHLQQPPSSSPVFRYPFQQQQETSGFEASVERDTTQICKWKHSAVRVQNHLVIYISDIAWYDAAGPCSCLHRSSYDKSRETRCSPLFSDGSAASAHN